MYLFIVRPQHERESALKAFRRGEVRFLVTTNVVSRGLGILPFLYLFSVILIVTQNDIERYPKSQPCNQLQTAEQYLSVMNSFDYMMTMFRY